MRGLLGRGRTGRKDVAKLYFTAGPVLLKETQKDVSNKIIFSCGGVIGSTEDGEKRANKSVVFDGDGAGGREGDGETGNFNMFCCMGCGTEGEWVEKTGPNCFFVAGLVCAASRVIVE